MITTVQKLRTVKGYAEQLKNHRSPFGYACLKSVSLIDTAIKSFNESFEAKQNELAMLNEDGSFKVGEKGGFIFSRESQNELTKLWKEQGATEIEYTPYIATNIDSVKDDLALLDALNGIIVNVDIEAMYNEQILVAEEA